jgi:hypothetical protein
LEGENKGIVKRRGPHEIRRVTKSVPGVELDDQQAAATERKISKEENESADVMKASIGGD